MSMNPANAAAAHKHFSAACFNASWDLISLHRSEEEDLVLLDLAHASLWHWRGRADCTRIKLSIGYWLLARVYALMGHADLAARYGKLSLDQTESTDFFYRGFAQEALARAGMVAGNRDVMLEHLQMATALAGQIPEKDDAAWLRENLADIFLPE